MTGGYELLLKFDPQVPRDAAKGWKALAHAAESTGNRHRTGQGLKVTDFREATDAKPYATFTARHPESRYVTDIDSTSDKRMVLGVTTPCLMPPSASPSPG